MGGKGLSKEVTFKEDPAGQVKSGQKSVPGGEERLVTKPPR